MMVEMNFFVKLLHMRLIQLISVNISVNDPTANEECYENETKKIKP